MSPAAPTSGEAAPHERAKASQTFEGVQILRGFAAMIVVFHHMCWVITTYHPGQSAIATFRRLAEVGAGGVDVFFCISGLVIAHAARNLSAGAGNARTFAWRRLLRASRLQRQRGASRRAAGAEFSRIPRRAMLVHDEAGQETPWTR